MIDICWKLDSQFKLEKIRPGEGDLTLYVERERNGWREGRREREKEGMERGR